MSRTCSLLISLELVSYTINVIIYKMALRKWYIIFTMWNLCFQLIMGLLQVGFIVMYLSETLVSGFTTAAAVHILVSQLRFVLGLDFPGVNGPLAIVYVSSSCSFLYTLYYTALYDFFSEYIKHLIFDFRLWRTFLVTSLTRMWPTWWHLLWSWRLCLLWRRSMTDSSRNYLCQYL